MATTNNTLESFDNELRRRGEQFLKTALSAPRTIEPGTILMVRRTGHSRSPVPGQDYYCPALVLEQFMPNGEIACFLFDYTAGVQYSGSYPIREVGARGEGATREMYEVQSNIGAVLFDPRVLRDVNALQDGIILLQEYAERSLVENHRTHQQMHDVHLRLDALEAFVADLKAPAAPVDLVPPSPDKKK